MHLERLFSVGSLRPQDSMRFVIANGPDEAGPHDLSVPDDWSMEAAESFQEAVCLNVPVKTHALEENTLPSWLWQHKGNGSETKAETSVLDVIDRIAGSATYKGWKLGLWSDEVNASIFFDEVRALLLTRRLILSPKDMATIGLSWSYGLASSASPAHVQTEAAPHIQSVSTLVLQNETIDCILRREEPVARSKWQKFLQQGLEKDASHIAFADTLAEWGGLAVTHNLPKATLNMAAFRTLDGEADCTGLEQAAKLAVILMDLCYDDLSGSAACADRPLALGIGNLSALLMSLALPYDSAQGRGTAAALTAIVTASATSASAQLASKLGHYASFGASRETTLRALRNMLRSSFGEKNDYDRLSILPQPLEIESGTDLVYISKARYALEEALRLTQKHGLRHKQLTTLFTDPTIAALMDGDCQGIEPVAALTCDYKTGVDDVFQKRMSRTVPLAMEKLGYDSEDIEGATAYLTGNRTLKGAPGVSLSLLRDKGLSEEKLTHIESSLTNAQSLEQAITPWTLGVDYCAQQFKLDRDELVSPSFTLLRALGFTTKDIEAANAFCFGHDTLKGALDLDKKHLSIFETRDQLTIESMIMMAGSVQSFISGDANLQLTVPASLSTSLREAFVIQAWEKGVKSVSFSCDRPYGVQGETRDHLPALKRQTASISPALRQERKQPARALKPKATGRSVTLKPRSTKTTTATKRG